MSSITDQTAIVIGAAKGIGRAVADMYAERGANVLAVDFDAAALLPLQTNSHTRTFVADLRDVNIGQMVADALGGIVPQILCICAGIYPNNPYAAMTDGQWQNVINTNLTGPVRVLRAILPIMAESNYGRVVLISSITGPIVVGPGYVHYAASKGGLEGAMRGLALEVAANGVTVNAVRPGSILTEGVRAASSERDIALMSKGIPVRRFGRPDEVAEAVYFLSLGNNAFITGQTLIVDGGQTLQEYQMGLLS